MIYLFHLSFIIKFVYCLDSNETAQRLQLFSKLHNDFLNCYPTLFVLVIKLTSSLINCNNTVIKNLSEDIMRYLKVEIKI